MRSHNYEFQSRDLLQLIAPMLLPVALFAALMHLGAASRWLPKPRPTLDVDRTILVHQAEASRSPHAAEVLLIGDSSCLMDVDARQLTDQLTPALNLATLSYLGLQSHANLLQRYFAANPDRAKAVVLLMHPEALRLVSPGDYHTRLLDHFLAGSDFVHLATIRDRVSHWLGCEIFRGRILARLLPTPLRGAYGRKYGFSSDLERHLAFHAGSATDPEPKKFQGNPEYRLAPQFESASRALRAAIPSGVKLLVGITPVPENFVNPDYLATRAAILNQWQAWLQPDVVLSSLPATLPNHLFVTTTHLSEQGARTYTAALAAALQTHLSAR